MKILLLLVDGMGDRPDAGGKTPLSQARKPAIDSLAKRGRLGLLDIGYERRAVNSDFGFLNILGCYSKQDYPGRGYLEALGLGLEPGPGDLCVRGNFATLDARGNMVDRRAGRDETGLEEFCDRLDGMEIGDVKFTVRKGAGHRVVVVLSGHKLSMDITPNDPLREGVALPQVLAKRSDSGAKFTASVLNRFVYRSRKLLEAEPANKKRDIPANVILIRNFGMKKETEGFMQRFGLKACCIAGIPIAGGVARFIGMDVADVKGATGMPDTDLAAKASAAIRALKSYDFVWLHINGTDILAHDKKREEKTMFIEKIDSEIVDRIANAAPDLLWIIACDHSTVSLPGWRAYEHVPDPVPVLLSGKGVKAGGRVFSEKECGAGFKMEANGLMSHVLKSVRS